MKEKIDMISITLEIDSGRSLFILLGVSQIKNRQEDLGNSTR